LSPLVANFRFCFYIIFFLWFMRLRRKSGMIIVVKIFQIIILVKYLAWVLLWSMLRVFCKFTFDNFTMDIISRVTFRAILPNWSWVYCFACLHNLQILRCDQCGFLSCRNTFLWLLEVERGVLQFCAMLRNAFTGF